MKASPVVDLAAEPALAPDTAAGRRALIAFCLCGLAMIAEGFDTYAVGYVGPALVKEWGVSQAALGSVYSVGVIASLFGSIVLGSLSDWIGRKWLLVLSSVAFAVATLFTARAPDLTALVLTRIATGIGLGASIPCAMALATEQALPRYRATVPVLLSACIGAGVVVASLVAAAVMPRFGWRGLMYVGGIFPLAVAVLMAPLLNDTPRPSKAERSRSRAHLRALFEPRLALIALVLIVGLIATYTVTFFFGFWLPTLMGSVVKDVRSLGLTNAVIKTFSILGGLTVGRLMDRYGGRRVVPVAFVAAAIVLVAAISDSHALIPLAIGMSAASFFLDGAFGGIIGFGAIIFPAHVRGAGIGLTVGVGRLIGGVLGPMLGGVLLGAGLSVKLVCAVFAGPLLIAAGAVWLAASLRGPEESAP